MNDLDRVEHRLAALGAGFDYSEEESFSIGLTPRIKRALTIYEWQPKTDKADAFDLFKIIYNRANSDQWGRIRVALSKADIKHFQEAIFNCAVEIGKLEESSNETRN